MQKYVLITASLLLSVASCSPGQKDLAGLERIPGHLHVEVNGVEMLESASMFRGRDRLVLIGSLGMLDAVTVILRDSLDASLQLRLVNSGRERQDISLLCMQFPLAARAPEGWNKGIWDLGLSRTDRAYICCLNTSGSSVVLLPEEELILPPILFFLPSLP